MSSEFLKAWHRPRCPRTSRAASGAFIVLVGLLQETFARGGALGFEECPHGLPWRKGIINFNRLADLFVLIFVAVPWRAHDATATRAAVSAQTWRGPSSPCNHSMLFHSWQ